MNKYTRKEINIKAQLHGKKFVTEEDAANALMELFNIALEAGADEAKLVEAMSDD